MPERDPRHPVAIVGLGGTISMSGDSGVVPALDADELVAAVPQLSEGPPLRARSVRNVPGADLKLADLDEVAAAVRGEIKEGVSGVVVVQGTDTLEEMAFGLDVLLGERIPVVVTGAMRNPTLPGADGPGNLFAAVHCAAADELRGLGVTVVMNDTIHAAARVQKAHTSRPDAFSSSPHGPLGWFQEGSPIIVDRGRIHFGVGSQVTDTQPRVPLLTVTMAPDIRSWEAVIESGIDGLVVEAFGVGHVPAVLAPLLVETAAEMPVVLSSRTRRGAVHRRTYGFVGSEQYLLDGGLASAGWLDPIKARMLLLLALRGGTTDLSAIFAPAV